MSDEAQRVKFFLYQYQGGGCDYTIACGESLSHLTVQGLPDPKNMEEAEAMAVSEEFLGCEEDEDYGPISSSPGESELKEARILAVVDDHQIPLDDYIWKAQKRNRAEQKEKADANERAEFERLRAKFGDRA